MTYRSDTCHPNLTQTDLTNVIPIWHVQVGHMSYWSDTYRSGNMYRSDNVIQIWQKENLYSHSCLLLIWFGRFFLIYVRCYLRRISSCCFMKVSGPLKKFHLGKPLAEVSLSAFVGKYFLNFYWTMNNWEI